MSAEGKDVLGHAWGPRMSGLEAALGLGEGVGLGRGVGTWHLPDEAVPVEGEGQDLGASPRLRVDRPHGVIICVGKEWYRYGTSFSLPDVTRSAGREGAPPVPEANAIVRAIGSGEVMPRPQSAQGMPAGPAEVAFLRSGFGGQLPQPFSRATGGASGRLVGFNDGNRQESSRRYVPLSDCDVVVDYALPWEARGSRSSGSKQMEEQREGEGAGTGAGAGERIHTVGPVVGDLEPWFRGLRMADLFPESVVGAGVLDRLGVDGNTTAGSAVRGGRLWSDVEEAAS